jgi:hypothetical protein
LENPRRRLGSGVKKEKAVVKENILKGTAKQILKDIKNMKSDELKTLLDVEGKGKNRKTVIVGIKKLLQDK